MRTEKEKKCTGCGDSFVFLSGSKREFDARKFCSPKCNGEFHAEKYSHERVGKGNPMFGKVPWNYAGNRKKMGYKKIWIDGKCYREHRVVMERHLGRKLRRDEIVHHKDHNPKNNNISNLVVMTKKKHASYHGKLQKKYA